MTVLSPAYQNGKPRRQGPAGSGAAVFVAFSGNEGGIFPMKQSATRKLVMAAMCAALGVVLPQAFHMVPNACLLYTSPSPRD